MIAKAGTSVIVRSPDAHAARGRAHRGRRRPSRTEPDGVLSVTNLEAAAIGDLAARDGIALHELAPQRASLEEAFMALTKDDVEFGGAR